MTTIRPAIVTDAPAICELVNQYAEQGLMLHRSLESVYDAIREFQVAVEDQRVVGCVAVDVFWSNLAELKSVAVAPSHRRKGLGKALVAAAVADATRLGVRRLFALTYEVDFFRRQGFDVVERMKLPEKVWRECLACPKVDQCDEVAVVKYLAVKDCPHHPSHQQQQVT